jgi:hypothetical protein
MFSVKFVAVVFLVSSLLTGGAWSGGRSKNSDLEANKNMSTTDDGELKVVAEGSVSPIKTTFVAVVRDAETFEALGNQAGNLPALDSEFFKSHIVIAAFLGERNTGGYSVAISREPQGQIRVAEKAPRKDMMVTQMITSPFKVVSLSISGTPPVSLSLGATFQQHAQLYRISSGTFSLSGGIAGRSETYHLAGKIQVTRLYPLITIGFAVVSDGTTRERMLRDYATGLVKDGGIAISKLSHGSLLDTPSGDLRVSGRFAEKNKILLDLDSGLVTVPDGFSGKGSIQAEMAAASAN